MPIYEYECLSCGDILEAVQKFNDEPLTICQKCGGHLKRIISNTSFVLKGTGWYKTDYASGTRKDKESGKKPEAKTEPKTEPKAEDKPEVTAKAK